jgi:thiosulfate/3-mercaptopyruvate sulfurtransferase
MNKLGLTCLVLLLSASGVATAAQLPGPVVSAAWLNEHRAEVVVLDVRADMAAFTTAPEWSTDAKTGAKTLVSGGGHIVGARPVDFNLARVSRMVGEHKIDKLLPSADEVQALVRSLGVNADDALVFTTTGVDPSDVDMAARLYWTLKTYGASNMALLDGGNAAWLLAGFPVATDAAPKLDAGNWTAGERNAAWLAQIDDLKPAAGPAPQLVDARPLPQYLGLVTKKPAVTAGGHVEGAVSYPIELQTRPAGLAQMFLTAEQYRNEMKALDIKPAAGAITYCNTGHMAAGAWFVLSEIMGNPGTRLYDGSMHEWTTLGRPVVGMGL